MQKSIGTDVNQTEITSLNHIKGQPHIVELLRTSLDAYFQNRALKQEKTTFGPVVLVGPKVEMHGRRDVREFFQFKTTHFTLKQSGTFCRLIIAFKNLHSLHNVSMYVITLYRIFQNF